MRKQTVGIDILVTSRKGDRKIMQSIRITSRPPMRKKEVVQAEPVQFNFYKSNTYRKDLSWLHFNDEPRAQERYKIKDQHKNQREPAYVFVAYLTIPSSNLGHQVASRGTSPDVTTVFHAWVYGNNSKQFAYLDSSALIFVFFF